jgi:RNA polymerase sigma-70 factor (ECF subfamily)
MASAKASNAMESLMEQGLSGPPQDGGVAAETASLAEFDAEAMPHLNDLYRTALRVLGDRARAEDVVQEVYLQAWKSFHRFERGTNCRAWLFKILFHCVNHHRRKWFRFPSLKETEEFRQANLAAPAPVAEQVTDGEILAALQRIPPDFRSVVLLVDVEEFAYRDAAEILRVPIGTIMSRLSRARRLLRDQLAGVARSYGIRKTATREEGA